MNTFFLNPAKQFSKEFALSFLFPKKGLLLLFLFWKVMVVNALNVPELREPINNTINLSRVFVLKIKPIADANTTYIFQLDITTNFNTPSLKSVTTADTAVAVYDCLYNTKYFWRVRAVNGATQSNWSPIYNFTTAKKQINPYNQFTTPQNCNFLFYHTATKLKRRYWLDTSASFNSPLLRDISFDTSLIIQQTESIYFKFLRFNTVYYLKAIAYNDQDTLFMQGSVVSFTTKKAPNKAAESIPMGNQILDNVVLNIGFEPFYDSINDISLTYISEMDTTALFNSAMKTTNYTKRLADINLMYGRQYYIRSKVAHPYDTSEWSIVGSFRTAAAPDIFLTGTYTDPDLVSFIRDKIQGSLKAEFCVFEKTGDPGYAKVLQDTVYIYGYIRNLDHGKSYLLVCREFSINDTSDYDSVKFSTNPLRLIYPQNNTTNVLGNPVLQMTRSNYATRYEIELDTSLSFASTHLQRFIHNDSNFTGFNVSALNYDQKYYWRGRMIRNGLQFDWCDTFVFYTGHVNVYATTPKQNDQQVDPKNLVLEWVKDPYAIGYYYQVATTTSFANPIVSKFIYGAGITSDSLPGLVYDKQYYVRFRQFNTADTLSIANSYYTKFETKPEDVTPQKVGLVTPINSGSTLYQSLTFIWNYSSWSRRYEVQLSKKNTFDSLLYSVSVTNLDFTVKDLEPQTVYFWRVRGMNDKTGPWSDVFQFTTVPVIGPPTGLIPDNFDWVGAQKAMLSWNKNPFASTYQYQIALNSEKYEFISPISVMDNFVTVPNLKYGETYKWRVRAYIIDTLTLWSNSAYFETGSVGLAGVDDQNDLQMNPNPVTTNLYINGNHLAGCTLNVYDANGLLKQSILISNDNPVVDMSELPTGFYFIEVNGRHLKIVKE